MKRWNVLTKFDSSTDFLSQILKARNIENIEEFLSSPPALSLLKGFEEDFKKSVLKAKALILEAIQNKKQILIYGDYDADGVSATAILFSTLSQELNYDKVYFFIPSRFDHGYGISKKALEHLESKGLLDSANWLFISVDTGITAVAETDYLKSKGITVILTDHHQKPDPLPQADCIVWSDRMVGAGISWVVSRALGSKSSDNVGFAALATVTDLQPVLGFNRSLVKEGLAVLNFNPPLGIKNLLQKADKKGEITTYDLGFLIGPRLNAGGRMYDAEIPFKLLTEKNPEISLDLAEKLQGVNSERQDKTVEMFEVAMGGDAAQSGPVIISASPEYHEGIIGLVASKLTQKYYKPSLVISLESEYGKGSVRSIPGIDIIASLRNFNDLFVNLGGHPMAAGFTIHKNNIEILREKLTKLLNDTIPPEIFTPSVEIDMEIPAELITFETFENIQMLKPFGIGNREPVFSTNGLRVISMNKVGRDMNHLALKLQSNGKIFKAIFWNNGEFFNELNVSDIVDVAYTFKTSEYNGTRSLDIVVTDIKTL